MTCVEYGERSYFTHEARWHKAKSYEDVEEEGANNTRCEPDFEIEANATNLAINTEKCTDIACNRPIEKNEGY